MGGFSGLGCFRLGKLADFARTGMSAPHKIMYNFPGETPALHSRFATFKRQTQPHEIRWNPLLLHGVYPSQPCYMPGEDSMGMTVGGGKGPSANINVTPMIDVLLVLLIIFMLLIPTVPTGENALVPQPSTEKNPTPEIINHTVVLQLTASSDAHPSIKINQEQVGWNQLESRLKAIFDLRNEKVIFLKADPKLEWEEVAQVIDVAHTAGVTNVGLITADMQQR
jgi:biopolymer transport protein TolR